MTSIGVVIVSFNTRDLLGECLASLCGCTLPLRVVVVDNASRDGSAALVRECFPHVELIELNKNVGFAAGTNVAVRLTETEGHLLFSVRDDGSGFDPGEARPGSGLGNMADRVAALGGTLEVTSAPSRGTAVMGRVPLVPPERAA